VQNAVRKHVFLSWELCCPWEVTSDSLWLDHQGFQSQIVKDLCPMLLT
jgi:hypothetical protein